MLRTTAVPEPVGSGLQLLGHERRGVSGRAAAIRTERSVSGFDADVVQRLVQLLHAVVGLARSAQLAAVSAQSLGIGRLGIRAMLDDSLVELLLQRRALVGPGYLRRHRGHYSHCQRRSNRPEETPGHRRLPSKASGDRRSISLSHYSSPTLPRSVRTMN